MGQGEGGGRGKLRIRRGTGKPEGELMRPLGHREVPGPVGVALWPGVPAASSSTSRLRLRPNELLR